MKVFQKEERKEKLIELGIPEKFIINLETKDRIWGFEEPYNSYDILADVHQDYKILKRYNIVPIYEIGAGDAGYYIYAFNDEEKRIIWFDLEMDEENKDYGENFQLLLFEKMIDYYEDQEIEDDFNINSFCTYGDLICFNYSTEVYEKMKKIDPSIRKSYAEFEKWKKKLTLELEIQ
ncbi:hypothetical protein [Aquimarina litoralis]|uniref:hypothetical protein n=1 Tax=Aquimarina litoralis TaxID=584605 RepID=UPI001C574411|nr:hypothetical protein [Aquimarina litoralis]MBW1294845.1 hypothetical protein [Aquimarina litoralis]